MTAVIHELLSSVMGVLVESVVSELSKHLSDLTAVLSEEWKRNKGTAVNKNRLKQANQAKTVSSRVEKHFKCPFLFFTVYGPLLFFFSLWSIFYYNNTMLPGCCLRCICNWHMKSAQINEYIKSILNVIIL